MSSANEHLAPPPKPRVSPLDFRNTDLVSRLLAATPPYLYNMSLLPNTYFFSEMLRSFVHAKAEANSRPMPGGVPTKRMRKRPWSSSRMESFHKNPSPPKLDQANEWILKNPLTEHKPTESPLELTTGKLVKPERIMDRIPTSKMSVFGSGGVPEHTSIYSAAHNNQDTNPSGLILPPPPPMWYPPLYPTAPYGIDPLHFFIDLRVSGHIYDGKEQRGDTFETETTSAPKTEPEATLPEILQPPTINRDQFRQSRHASAFSVPVSHLNRTTPMNLSHAEDQHERGVPETKNTKFDVKSMGFEKECNKTGTTYVMSNIMNIYKNAATPHEAISCADSPDMQTNVEDNETEEERQKRVKDLRALIGLELVVDYMNHAKPPVKDASAGEESSSTDIESIDSPALEVVALHDET